MKIQIFIIALFGVVCWAEEVPVYTSSPWDDDDGVGYAKALVQGQWGRICVDDPTDKTWAHVFCKELGTPGASFVTYRNLRAELGLHTLKKQPITMHNPQCPDKTGPWIACTPGPECKVKSLRKAVYIYCMGVWTAEWD